MSPRLPAAQTPHATSPTVALRLQGLYQAMESALGPQGWWPGRTRFEIIVGAS